MPSNSKKIKWLNRAALLDFPNIILPNCLNYDRQNKTIANLAISFSCLENLKALNVHFMHSMCFLCFCGAFCSVSIQRPRAPPQSAFPPHLHCVTFVSPALVLVFFRSLPSPVFLCLTPPALHPLASLVCIKVQSPASGSTISAPASQSIFTCVYCR